MSKDTYNSIVQKRKRSETDAARRNRSENKVSFVGDFEQALGNVEAQLLRGTTSPQSGDSVNKLKEMLNEERQK